MDAVGLLLDQIAETLPGDRTQLRRLKNRVAAMAKAPLIRNDALLTRYRTEVAQGRRQSDPRLEQTPMLNRIRSQSGIAIVTVITEPYACPGRCVYCPTEAHAPKSYLTNEPAVQRALRNDYDPARQVRSRLEALHDTGHPTDKVELIIKGGENIAPREIDEALLLHAQVLEAAAFAVPSIDYGQTVEAAVRLTEGGSVTEDELLALCRDRVGPFKAPDRVHILPDLPKGPSGKVQRLKLAEMMA